MVETGPGTRSTTARQRHRPPAVARGAGLLLAAGAATTLLGGCSAGEAFRGFGWPQHGVTEQAHKMYNLWIGSVLAALAVGVFVWGLIFWSIVRYRKRGEELPPQVRYNLPIETLYTIAPFLIIAVLFYYTAVTETAVTKVDNTTKPDVRVEVVAFQWNWQFNYLDETTPAGPVSTIGSSDVVPVLVVPTHERIRFILHSRDVIHSFWVPEMLFKRDVIPGVTNQFEATVDREGAYVGRCAELCGAYHSMMNFEVRAVTPEQYQQYMTLREQNLDTTEALKAVIGGTGLAVTTSPFTQKPDTGPAH